MSFPPPDKQERGGLRQTFIDAPVDIASQVVFRIAFGAIMVWEAWRYYTYGWIERYYIEPEFFFTYYGFGWITPWDDSGMYYHFVALALAAALVALGLWYRAASIFFFFAFTYVFLLDQSNYLNHFYLVSLLGFLMMFLSPHRLASLDIVRRPELRADFVPAWTLWALRAQIGIVYFYGGIAKINGDWLRGEPMRDWLGSRADFPLIGAYFAQEWMVYLFSYGGLLLDLLVVPALLWRKTRVPAFIVATGFHLTNAQLFSIGIFPWFMIAATTIYFEPGWPRRLLGRLRPTIGDGAATLPRRVTPAMLLLLVAYFSVQLLFPLRHWFYPGNVNWTEEGHRFSWHMKLRDKDAITWFMVTDNTGESWPMDPEEYLWPRQADEMSSRPDMILQFAHFVARELEADDYGAVEIRAESTASLNGREPQYLIDPTIDLTKVPRNLRHADWIVPLTQPLRPPAERRP